MGNTSVSSQAADWLLVNSDFDIKLLNKKRIDDLTDAYTKYQKGQQHKLYISDYGTIHQNLNPRSNPHATWDWEYYRDIARNATQNPIFSNIPKMHYFIFAQFYPNTHKNKIIPKTLRLSLLANLCKLSRDETLKYDFRDATNGHYLYYKTSQFGIADIYTKFEGNSWLELEDKTDHFGDLPTKSDFENKQNEIKQDRINMEYLEKENIFRYKLDDNKKNTAFIHDLLDPNKNLHEHRLWIPTIFDCEYEIFDINNLDVTKIIKSPILNLDFVKYKSLYSDIAKVFKLLIQPMFENILKDKLGPKEKVIVKSMQYVLQKPGDFYKGNIHREGMGEKIVAIAIYYPQVNDKKSGMKDGTLKLQIPEICNSFLKCHTFEIEQGSSIAFSNEGYHQLPLIEYDKKSKNNVGPISRTILAFFLVNKYDSDHVIASDNNILLNVNLDYYWKYYIEHWIRKSKLERLNNYKWMMDMIFMYLFEANYNDYVYYRRYKMRKEKGKPLHEKTIMDTTYSDTTSCEETIYAFGDNYVQ